MEFANLKSVADEANVPDIKVIVDEASLKEAVQEYRNAVNISISRAEAATTWILAHLEGFAKKGCRRATIDAWTSTNRVIDMHTDSNGHIVGTPCIYVSQLTGDTAFDTYRLVTSIAYILRRVKGIAKVAVSGGTHSVIDVRW